MRQISAVELVSLDGVMQSPGRADEDTRGVFDLGGWAQPYNDEISMREMGMRQSTGGGAMLFGRRTYEDFAETWPKRAGNPVTTFFEGVQKYVVSNTLSTPLPWVASTLLSGDAIESVTRLKETDGPNLVILGSGELVRSLYARGLIDRFVLSIHPLTLGKGRRLFGEESALSRMTLVSCVPTTKGLIIATYETARDV